MKTKNPGTRSLFVVLAISAVAGFAALALLGASRSAAGRAGGDLCLATLAAYEEAVDRAEETALGRSNPESLAALRRKAYADYADCVARAGASSAASLERSQMSGRPPFTPPGHRGTPPPFAPPRGTPGFVPPMTPPGRMMTPPGPPFTPPRGRPPMTPPGPPMTPPGQMMTPPGHMVTPPGPPITPPGH